VRLGKEQRSCNCSKAVASGERAGDTREIARDREISQAAFFFRPTSRATNLEAVSDTTR